MPQYFHSVFDVGGQGRAIADPAEQERLQAQALYQQQIRDMQQAQQGRTAQRGRDQASERQAQAQAAQLAFQQAQLAQQQGQFEAGREDTAENRAFERAFRQENVGRGMSQFERTQAMEQARMAQQQGQFEAGLGQRGQLAQADLMDRALGRQQQGEQFKLGQAQQGEQFTKTLAERTAGRTAQEGQFTQQFDAQQEAQLREQGLQDRANAIQDVLTYLGPEALQGGQIAPGALQRFEAMARTDPSVARSYATWQQFNQALAAQGGEGQAEAITRGGDIQPPGTFIQSPDVSPFEGFMGGVRETLGGLPLPAAPALAYMMGQNPATLALKAAGDAFGFDGDVMQWAFPQTDPQVPGGLGGPPQQPWPPQAPGSPQGPFNPFMGTFNPGQDPRYPSAPARR